jgi:hypothetical protein
MSEKEEELQKNLEEGKTPIGDDLNVMAYQRVFSALKNEPPIFLHTSFADQVIGMVERNQRKNTFREYFWIAIGTFLLLSALATSIMLTDFNISAGVFSGLSSYKGLLIFGVSFIGVLHWLDRRLLKNKKAVF